MRKRAIDPRHGAVMEMALLVLLLVLGLSIVLVSTAFIHAEQKESAMDNTQFRMQMDAIGEEICTSFAESGVSPAEVGDYVIVGLSAGFTYEMTVYHKTDTEREHPCLYITLVEEVDGKFTVRRWEYGTPTV